MMYPIVLAVAAICVVDGRLVSLSTKKALETPGPVENAFSKWAVLAPARGEHDIQMRDTQTDEQIESFIMKPHWAKKDVPKVYVYDLPGYEIPKTIEGVFGRKETLSLVRGSVQSEMSVRVVDQYEADTMYMYYLKGSPYRTMNPDEADLFYVPLAHYHVGWGELNLKLNKTGPAIEENLPRMLHYLNRTTANRHVQIAGHTGDIGCAYWYSQGPLLAPMYRLSLEHYANRGLKHYRSIIYPTVASGMDKQEVKKLMSAAATGPRPYFIMSLFGLHGSAGAVALRKNLHNQCTAGKKCLRDPVSAFEISTASGRHGVYLKSTFCLEPPGDSPSRKAILDVMIAGCIPVLFWKNQTELWPYHVKSWDQVSILIEPENHHKTIDVLKAVSSERIQILQQNIIGLIPLLSYKPFGTNEDYDDAFEATLVGLWQEIRTSSS